ncbi:hypothetical protein ABIC20_004985 [Methylobacterium radiotolerans]|uniref:Uncharacterized protein n=1 Tax=Methylobacterium radiotolerans TaxID=31998 RepID=A0ABV2NMP8_9HYPH
MSGLFEGEILEGERPGGAAAHAAHLLLERVDPQGVLDRDLEPLRARGLDHEIHRAGPHRADHRVDGPVRGLDDDRRGEAALAHLGQDTQPVEPRHDEVEEHDIRPLGSQKAQRVRARLGDPRLEAETAHGRLGQAPLDRIVIHDEHGGGHSGSLNGARRPDTRRGFDPLAASDSATVSFRAAG